MTDLSAALDDLAPLPELRTLVEAVASQRPVHPERQAGYVSLRPGGGGPIAAFVNKGFIDVAQPPHLAAAKAAGLPGATLHEETPATTFVRVRPEAAHEPAALVLVKEALEWRSTMPDTRGQGGQAGQPSAPLPPACATCGLHHAGECD